MLGRATFFPIFAGMLALPALFAAFESEPEPTRADGRVVQRLPPRDQYAICSSLQAQYTDAGGPDAVRDFACRYVASVAAADVSTERAPAVCSAVEARCRLSPPVASTAPCTPRHLDSCDVSIRELRTCVAAQAAGAKELAAALACDRAGQDGRYDNAVSPFREVPAACVAVAERCPDFLYGPAAEKLGA